jgi:hypothetical protein
MKALSFIAVHTMMDLLIHTNGQTTSKEVKEALRNLGYYATQDQVKNFMNELYDDIDSEYVRNTSADGTHQIYTVFGMPKAVDYVEPSKTQPMSAVSVPHVQLVVTKNVKKDVRDPEFIFYAEKHAKSFAQTPGNENKWMVYGTDRSGEIQVYSESLTRDQIRSRYASIIKIKMQDVRSCKAKNF